MNDKAVYRTAPATPGLLNILKLVLFMLYQGVWWLQHTVKSAFQPLVFIHVIDIRCYETNVADDCYAYCSNQLSCL